MIRTDNRPVAEGAYVYIHLGGEEKTSSMLPCKKLERKISRAIDESSKLLVIELL